VLTKSMSDK